jgi:hypothetical protein
MLTFATAPFEALYHTKPGLGLVAPMLAILIIAPPPLSSNAGAAAGILKNTLLTFTVKHLSNSASVTSAVGFGDAARDGGNVVGDVRGREVLRQAVAVQVGGHDFAAFRDEEVGYCEAKAGCGACSDAEWNLARGEQGEIWKEGRVYVPVTIATLPAKRPEPVWTW